MDSVWKAALWRQFGAAINMIEKALAACPDSQWRGRLWSTAADPDLPPQFSEFWYLTYHTIFWLDLYIEGSREEDFAPPAPFAWTEAYPVWVIPESPYTREDLHAYLNDTRRKVHTVLMGLTDEQASRTVEYGWIRGEPVSYLELVLYNMRHVQEHAAQLCLFLGQQGVPDEAIGTVTRANDLPAGR